jgi:hypothetical protein
VGGADIGGLAAALAHACRRRALGHRRLEVEDRGHGIGLDDDDVDAVGGDRLALGHDQGHGLPREDNLLAGQRFAHAPGGAGRHGQVGGRQHGHDAGHLERG